MTKRVTRNFAAINGGENQEHTELAFHSALDSVNGAKSGEDGTAQPLDDSAHLSREQLVANLEMHQYELWKIQQHTKKVQAQYDAVKAELDQAMAEAAAAPANASALPDADVGVPE